MKDQMTELEPLRSHELNQIRETVFMSDLWWASLYTVRTTINLISLSFHQLTWEEKTTIFKRFIIQLSSFPPPPPSPSRYLSSFYPHTQQP